MEKEKYQSTNGRGITGQAGSLLYFQNSYIDKLTFHKLYEEWLEYKKDGY